MKPSVKIICLAALAVAALCCRAGEPAPSRRCDFDSVSWLRKKTVHRGLPLIPHTLFYLADEPTAQDGRVLVVEALRSTGVLVFRIDGLDLNKYPIMRWRWRVIRQVDEIADGELHDDQACVIYISDGTPLQQKCVGYRWEHRVPVGTRRMVKYGSAQVDALCLRDRGTPVGEWVVEERNVVEDFKTSFGAPPSASFAIAVGANSQHSNSHTKVEIDYIEFLPAPEKKTE